jgi:serine/threonine-protein kinase HipA
MPAQFVEAAGRLGLRERATNRMIDSIVDAADEWPDRCEEIGFDTRRTELLTDILRSRITTLK